MRAVQLRQPPSGPFEEFEIPEGSDDIENQSSVPGLTVTDALDALLVAAGVLSVFGRNGAVVAATGDYDSDQVDNVSSVAGASTSDALETLAADLAAAILTLVPDTRAVNTGTGLTGGGPLSGDLTLSVPPGGIGTTELAADSVSVAKVDPIDTTQPHECGQRLTFVIAWAGGGGGGAGDATLFNANLPFKCRYIGAICMTTGIGAGTGGATIRTAAGGLGNQISTSMGTTTTATRTVDASGGIVLPNHTLAAGSSLFLRLTDNTASGLLYIDVLRID
jgi:hypothetical protein